MTGTVVVHGGLRRAELDALGLDPASVVDLSANLNPLGPDPRVLAAAAHADVTRYPEPDAASLRDRIAERTGLASSEVLVTPGATAAVHLVARALLAAGDACWLFPPTSGSTKQPPASPGRTSWSARSPISVVASGPPRAS